MFCSYSSNNLCAVLANSLPFRQSGPHTKEQRKPPKKAVVDVARRRDCLRARIAIQGIPILLRLSRADQLLPVLEFVGVGEDGIVECLKLWVVGVGEIGHVAL